MFYVLFVRKNFFHPNLRGGSPEKFISVKKFLPTFFGKIWKKYGKIGKNMEKYGTVVILARM
jgi:hypothetical protein